MPEDINARIVVAVEASAARQGIDNVKKGMKGITDARERDLKIAQAKSRMELAEYQSEIAAQKAYNAELQLETAEKLKQIRIKRGADKDEIEKRTERIQRFRGEVLKLQQAEAAANLQAYQSKKAYEDLLTSLDEATASADEATKGTEKLTGAQVAARAAGRALGIDLSGTSTAMIKLGIIAAGAAAAVKLLKFAYDESRESAAEYVRVQVENAKSIEETERRLRNYIDARSEDLRTLAEYGGRQDLTIAQTYALNTAIERLGKNFRGLKLEIKDAGDQLADYGLIAAQNEAKANEERIASLRREAAAISASIAEKERAMSTAGVDLMWLKKTLTFVGFDVMPGANQYGRFGGSEEIEKYQEEINEAKNRILALNREIGELMNQNPVEDYLNNMVRAIREVTNRDINTRLQTLEQERRYQALINSGREREAELLKIRNQLDQEASRLQGEQLAIFNRRRHEIELSMIASYDQRVAAQAERAEQERLRAAERAEQERLRAAERAEQERLRAAERERERLESERAKQRRDIQAELYSSQMNMRIQRLRVAGWEREADLLQIKLQLDQREKTLSGQLLADFRRQRFELERQLVAQRDLTEQLEAQRKSVELRYQIQDIERETRYADWEASGQRERAARARINLALDQTARGLQGEELAEFNYSRQRLFDARMAQWQANEARSERERQREQERRQREQAEQERERTVSARRGAYDSIAGELMKFAETAQNAVTSTSLEGLRLQSRIFMNTGVSLTDNPAKQSAASLKVIQVKLTAMEGRLNEVTAALSAISGNTRSLNGMKFHAY